MDQNGRKWSDVIINTQRKHDGKRTPKNIADHSTAVVRPCMGGNAELIGDTCAAVTLPVPPPASASAVTEVERLEDIAEGLGVAGVFAVGTFPINHDWKW